MKSLEKSGEEKPMQMVNGRGYLSQQVYLKRPRVATRVHDAWETSLLVYVYFENICIDIRVCYQVHVKIMQYPVQCFGNQCDCILLQMLMLMQGCLSSCALLMLPKPTVFIRGMNQPRENFSP
jgi:hypothetical protein